MRYKLDDIATFVQAVEAGSLSAAARRLGLSKSVVSKRVGDLEAALGAALLQRTPRRVVPTDAGTAYYQRARAILAELDHAAEAAAGPTGALRGSLRIAAPMSFGQVHLGPALFPLAQRHPELELAIDLDDRFVDLVGEGYDLGIRIGRLADSTLVARKLTTSRILLCASPDYLARAGTPRTIDDLAGHAHIGYANRPAATLPMADGPMRPLGRPRLLVNNGELAREAALAGLGLAVLPSFIAAEALRAGRLVPVLCQAPLAHAAVSAILPPTRHRSAKVRAVLDHLAACWRDPPPWEDGLGLG